VRDEFWDDLKKWSTDKKEHRRSLAPQSIEILTTSGLAFEVKNGGEHYIVEGSPAENRYFDRLAAHLRGNWVLCPIYPELRAVERSHPRGVAFWETGAGIKGTPLLRRRSLETCPP